MQTVELRDDAALLRCLSSSRIGIWTLATIAQEAFLDLDAPIVRLATSDQPIPSADFDLHENA